MSVREKEGRGEGDQEGALGSIRFVCSTETKHAMPARLSLEDSAFLNRKPPRNTHCSEGSLTVVNPMTLNSASLSTQGEPGKAGERGVPGPPGPVVSISFESLTPSCPCL